MACVNEGSHSSTCHPHIYPQVERTIPALTTQPQSITALWPVHIFHPTEGTSLSWPKWLVTRLVDWSSMSLFSTNTAISETRVVTNRAGLLAHPSTNRVRHRVTSLMETNALPLSQATTCTQLFVKMNSVLDNLHIFMGRLTSRGISCLELTCRILAEPPPALVACVSSLVGTQSIFLNMISTAQIDTCTDSGEHQPSSLRL